MPKSKFKKLHLSSTTKHAITRNIGTQTPHPISVQWSTLGIDECNKRAKILYATINTFAADNDECPSNSENKILYATDNKSETVNHPDASASVKKRKQPNLSDKDDNVPKKTCASS